MNQISKHKILIGALALAGVLFTGCAATQTAISKRNLDVQTKMSETVFLDPVEETKQTVYLQVRNTSDQELAIDQAIRGAIESRGYRITGNPSKAHYMLQASVLQVGKGDQESARRALLAGYGSSIDGAAIGLLAAAASNNHSSSGYGGFGLIGAAVGTIADAAVKDVTYTMITDLQISERAPEGGVINQQSDATLTQGTSTRVIQRSSSASIWKRHRTRIVSTANKVNLDFAEAKPELERGLIRSISGIF